MNMAEHQDAVAGAAAPAGESVHPQSSTQEPPAERPVEVSDIHASPALSSSSPEHCHISMEQAPQQPPVNTEEPPPTITTTQSQTAAGIPHLTRMQSEALGPAIDAPIAHPSTSATMGPTINISLMLTTGARHPYKIDEKYLRSRKVGAQNAEGGFDPREISGYQLKELIWTDWRSEWEPRPASPSSIRLIIMGRMIDDKFALKGETEGAWSTGEHGY